MLVKWPVEGIQDEHFCIEVFRAGESSDETGRQACLAALS